MTELKDLLREGADRAKHYDVTERAWVRGRRRRRLRLAAGSATVATVISTVVIGMTLTIGPRLAPPADSVALPRSCDVTQLPLPVGSSLGSSASTTDPTGRFIGGSAEFEGNRYSLLLWDNGEVRELTTVILGSIRDINRRGDLLVSNGLDVPESQHHSDGQWTKLKGPTAAASGLNDSGVIVGTVGETPTIKPVVWRAPSAEPEPLALPSGAAAGWARDVTDDGYIVGWVSAGHPHSGWRPAVWTPQGEVRVLSVPDEAQGHWNALMLRVVGDAVDVQLDIESEPSRYYRFALAGGEGVRLVTDDHDVIAFMHNGWRLVRSWPSRLTVVSGSTRTDLQVLPDRTLWPVPTDDPRTSAIKVNGISDDGRVIAGMQAVLADGFSRAVAAVWRCR